MKPIEDKNFLHFFGKPLLQWQIEELIQAGLKDLIVVGGKHNLVKIKELIEEILVAAGKKSGLKIVAVEQKDLDEGMAGALLSAENFIKSDAVFVVSANDIVDQEAYKLILDAAKDGGKLKLDGFLLGKKVKNYFPGGYLKVSKDGLIQSIVEKPGAGKEPSDMINLVLHFHRDGGKLLEFVKKTKSSRDDRYEMAMDAMIKSGSRLKVVPYNGFWQPIKYPWHVISVMNYFLESCPVMTDGCSGCGGDCNGLNDGQDQGCDGDKNCCKSIQIAESATIHSAEGAEVYLEDGVRIMDNAVIVGPAYIGKNTIVATNALVRGSHIGANCVIGFGTEVARSYVGENVWTHTNYIGDSIIGDNCSFGAGTVTGNLRLDEANIPVNIQGEKVDSGTNKFGLVTGNGVRCGINTSFMPGIKIGNNCFIGAGITIAQDIEDNKFVYGKTELVIKENKAKLDDKKRQEMKKKIVKK